MEIIGGAFRALIDVWKEMWKGGMPMIGIALSFSLWVLSAIIILPCVYVSGVLYPLWEKWGEKF